jgi:hypothetical protein
LSSSRPPACTSSTMAVTSSWLPRTVSMTPSHTRSAPAAAPAHPGAVRGAGHRDHGGHGHRRRIEEIRGAAQLSIGTKGPVSLPRDSSETLALVLSRGLPCAERDDHANGRPLVYGPTPRVVQLLGAETLDEARGRLGVPADTGV